MSDTSTGDRRPAARILVTAVVLWAALATNSAFGQGTGGMLPGPIASHDLAAWANQLELSDEQRDQIEGIIEAGRPAIEALRDQMAQARQGFRDSHVPGSFDEAEATAFAQSQSQLHAQIIVETMRLKSQVFAVLTPEQREQLRELRDETGDRFRGRHGCRRGGEGD